MSTIKRKPTLEEFKQMAYEQDRHPLLWKIERYRRWRMQQIMADGDKWLEEVCREARRRAFEDIKAAAEREPEPDILVNKIQCRHCGDILESKTAHDFKRCSCGKVGIDGGRDWLRRIGYTEDYIELSEFIETKDIAVLERRVADIQSGKSVLKEHELIEVEEEE